MASKIQSHTFYVAINPYKAGANEEEFNELSVMTAFDDRSKYFYVSLHAGWKSGWGGHGCIFLGPDDPLTAPKYIKVKDSPKNSQKTINEIGASLELARDAIAWLFNKRDWARLYNAVRNIALNGYTEQYKQQMEKLMNPEPVMHQVDVMALMGALQTTGRAKLSDFATPVEINNDNELNELNELEDKTMRLNMNASKSENVNVQAAAPVNNASSSESRAESYSGYAESREGSTIVNPIEDAVAVEITTEADVQEVNDILPKVTPRKPAEIPAETLAEEKPAVTVPLSDHGTMVVGGVPKRDKSGKFVPKAKSETKAAPKNEPKPEPEAVGELAGMLTKVEFVTYKTKKGNDAPMIVGFSGEDDARWKKLHDAKPKWVSVGYRNCDDGSKKYHLMFGSRYMNVAKALCAAYNTTDRNAWAKAESLCAGCYESIVSGFKAEKETKRAERKAAREAKKSEELRVKSEESANASTTGYSDQDVADMLRKVMAGGDVPENIKKLLQAA